MRFYPVRAVELATALLAAVDIPALCFERVWRLVF
jgi:hypothetical protein